MAGIGHTVPTEQELLIAIQKHIDNEASTLGQGEKAALYLETAGGVHSPSLYKKSQADFYRPFRLPTVLVADSKLGGISTTLTSYESLLMRGFDVDAVMCLKEDYYENYAYLEEYFGDRGIHVGTMAVPPPKTADDKMAMTEYYSNADLSSTIEYLDKTHQRRLEDLDSMPSRTIDTVWWPFTQHGLIKEKDVTVVDSAIGDYLISYQSQDVQQSMMKPLFDASASWWTQALGHSNPELTLAAAYAAGRYGHVLFPNCTNEPALTLSERLVNGPIGQGWASRCFFSDDGATGMEVALKMAIRASSKRYNYIGEVGVLGLSGSYHGDTIGAMDACEGGVFNAAVEWHHERGYWFEAPQVMIKEGRVVISNKLTFNDLDEAFDIETRIKTDLYKEYCEQIRSKIEELVNRGTKFGALVIEPIVMGAGGMIFVDPLYQRALVDTVRSSEKLFGAVTTDSSSAGWSGLPVIFDQVFVGMHRLGRMDAASFLDVRPDITVLAKILTGGVVPLSVTLASDAIFQTFYGDKKVDALLHGHSYTANPIGCTVSNKTLDIIERVEKGEDWGDFKSYWGDIWSVWDKAFIDNVSRHDKVEGVMAMGTVLAIYLKAGDSGYQSTASTGLLSFLRHSSEASSNVSPVAGGVDFNILARPLGNVVYVMTSLNTSRAVVKSIEEALKKGLAMM